MFRKSIIAIAALATLATAALPTTASAHRWRHGPGFVYGAVGLGLLGAGIVAGSCYQYQWVRTPYGWRQVLVNTCGY